MIVVLAHITVVTGCEAAFEMAARDLAAATLERERGIRRYEYVRLSEPAKYHATLAFDDYDAFIEHQASEHHVALTDAMKPLMEHISLERLDPIAPGPSDEPGAIAEVPSDVLEDRRERYRARYPFPVASWWGIV